MLGAATFGDLSRALVPRRLPSSENMGRRYYGRALNLNLIEAALRNAEMGLMADITDLENESISLYPHASGVLCKRFGQVAALDWSLVPAHGRNIDKVLAREMADDVREQFESYDELRLALYRTAWGMFHGRSAQEIYYRLVGGMRRRWELEGLGWIHPRRVSFGDERQLQLIDTWRQGASFSAEGFNLRDYPGKFLTLVPELYADYPEKEGLGPRTLYWSFFQRSSWRWRLALTELFANGWRVLEPAADASVGVDELDEAVADVEALGENSTVQLPAGVKLNVVFPGGDGVSDLFQMTPKDVDEQISKLVLGQTGTTDATANRAEAVVMRGEQDIFLASDARTIEVSWQRGLVRPLCELNWGHERLSHAPRLRLHSEQGRDVDKEVARMNQILQWGIPLAEGEVREVVGYRKPEPDEAYVVLDQPSGVNALGQPNPGKMRVVDPGELEAGGVDQAAANAAKDLLAADGGAARRPLGGRLLAIAQPNGSPADVIEGDIAAGQKAMERIVEQVLEAVEGAGSYAAASNALTDLAPDVDDLADHIFVAMMRAAMLGADDAATEQDEGAAVRPETFERDPLTLELPPVGLLDPKADPNGWIAQGKFRPKTFWEAIEQFLGRGAVTREAFDAMATELAQRAFTVARLASDEAVKKVQEAIARSIKEGTAFKVFAKGLRKLPEASGLTTSHVETVYRTNVMGAYSDGRGKQMAQPHVVAALPYWQIVGVGDGPPRERPTHANVNGWVMRADDPGWQVSGWPPWGFNCRHRIVARTAKWVERNNPTIWTGPLPDLPDEGFIPHPAPGVG
jgi:SPP1 gp7 family putative phage head morphogenesis protein